MLQFFLFFFKQNENLEVKEVVITQPIRAKCGSWPKVVNSLLMNESTFNFVTIIFNETEYKLGMGILSKTVLEYVCNYEIFLEISTSFFLHTFPLLLSTWSHMVH